MSSMTRQGTFPCRQLLKIGYSYYYAFSLINKSYWIPVCLCLHLYLQSTGGSGYITKEKGACLLPMIQYSSVTPNEQRVYSLREGGRGGEGTCGNLDRGVHHIQWEMCLCRRNEGCELNTIFFFLPVCNSLKETFRECLFY